MTWQATRSLHPLICCLSIFYKLFFCKKWGNTCNINASYRSSVCMTFIWFRVWQRIGHVLAFTPVPIIENLLYASFAISILPLGRQYLKVTTDETWTISNIIGNFKPQLSSSLGMCFKPHISLASLAPQTLLSFVRVSWQGCCQTPSAPN